MSLAKLLSTRRGLWFRVGCATTNNRITAARLARDRIGPPVVEVLADVLGPVIERWRWTGRRWEGREVLRGLG